MRDEDNQPCTSTTAGPPPIMRKRIQTPSSSRYSVSRALSTSLASRPSTIEAARITATTTNKTINVMLMDAMIAQKRANRIQERHALLVLSRRGRTSPYIDLTNNVSVPQSQTSRGVGRHIPG